MRLPGSRGNYRLSSCGACSQLLSGRWHLPGPGIEPLSCVLAGEFFTTEPPGKPRCCGASRLKPPEVMFSSLSYGKYMHETSLSWLWNKAGEGGWTGAMVTVKMRLCMCCEVRPMGWGSTLLSHQGRSAILTVNTNGDSNNGRPQHQQWQLSAGIPR